MGRSPSPKKITPVESRQGVKGHNVRLVLLLSLIGTVVAMIVAYFLFFPLSGPSALGPG
jgi:hypothetical protein